MATGKPPTCPKCGSKGPFMVWVTERVPYLWDGGSEWEPGREESEMLGKPYIVQCVNENPVCDHEFEAEPWD